MKIKTFKELIVWQKGIELVILIYQLSARFPKEEKYGLTSQLRRSAVAIPSNIAEGFGRRYLGEYIQFLYISLSSLFEVDTQYTISQRLGFHHGNPKVELLMVEIDKMLKVLISKLKKTR